MQTPSGDLIPFEGLDAAREEAERLEELTGKPHPVYQVDQIVEISGGKWRVTKILTRGRMHLKAHPY